MDAGKPDTVEISYVEKPIFHQFRPCSEGKRTTIAQIEPGKDLYGFTLGLKHYLGELGIPATVVIPSEILEGYNAHTKTLLINYYFRNENDRKPAKPCIELIPVGINVGQDRLERIISQMNGYNSCS